MTAFHATKDLDLANIVFAYPDPSHSSEQELNRAIRETRLKRKLIRIKRESLFNPNSAVPPDPKSLEIRLVDFGEGKSAN